MNCLDPRRQRGFGTLSVLALLGLYLPLLVLVVFSLNAGNLFNRLDGLSLDWYRMALADEGFVRAARNSLLVAVPATAIATAVAVFAALGLERGRSGGRLVTAVLDLPLVIPEIVMAVGMLSALSLIRQLTGIDLGIGNLILVHAMFCIPFALAPIRARLRGIPPILHLAAADLHATPADIFRRITLPLLVPAIASGAALAFVVSFDDFAISQLVAGPGQTTLPVFIWAQLRRPLTPEVNAMCVIVLLATLVLVCLSTALSQVRKPRPIGVQP
jgi:spermidine/putrescine transport system permease protein